MKQPTVSAKHEVGYERSPNGKMTDSPSQEAAMTAKEKLLHVIEQTPEPLLTEALHYLEYLIERCFMAKLNPTDVCRVHNR